LKKSRTFNALSGFKTETWFTTNGGPKNGLTAFQPKVVVTDSVSSGEHNWPPKGGQLRDIGGNFALIQRRAYFANTGVSLKSPKIGSIEYYRAGDISPVALPSGAQFPAAPALSNGSLHAWGATGFARTIPTTPESDIATMLGEFSIEGIPRDPRDLAERWRDTAAAFRRSFESSRNPRRWMARARAGRRFGNDVGGAHLAVAFTWAPFLREVTNITNAYLDRAETIAQFERDSGRLVRRRIVLENERYADPPINMGASYGWPSGSSYLWSGPGELTQHNSYQRRTWFSGAFTYYVNFPGSGLLHARGAQLRHRLFGAGITPSALWNIAPWSWLADYGTNIGDVMTNMTQFSRDNLVARHAYVMSTATAVREYKLRGLQPRTGPPIEATLMLKTTSKLRARGSPYSFAITPQPLSGRQTAILAALGLTRL
jgi:hypothetical protein